MRSKNYRKAKSGDIPCWLCALGHRPGNQHGRFRCGTDCTYAVGTFHTCDDASPVKERHELDLRKKVLQEKGIAESGIQKWLQRAGVGMDKTVQFRADMLDLVLAGKKTVALVPMVPQPEEFFLQLGETLLTFYARSGDHQLYTESQVTARSPLGEVGDRVTVYDRPDIKLRIGAIRCGRIHEMPKDDWKKAGLSDPSEDSAVAHWDSFYGDTEYRWENSPWVWGIEFEVVKESAIKAVKEGQ